MKPYSILHISDLHRSPDDPISNAELISALVADRDRYTHEDPQVAEPEAIVVSGDVIHGVPVGTSNHEARLAEQYAVAENFFHELTSRLLAGDRSRLVLVPGNHDVDWNTAYSALERVDPKDIPADLLSLLYADGSPFRWDWRSRTLFRIANRAVYERRLDAFWRFFERFYVDVPGLLSVHPGDEVNLFNLCDGRICLAAFNSCHDNDCYAFHGMIPREAIARSHLQLNDCGHIFDLRVAVWHHSIEGPPYRTDYMDVDIVRGMIGRAFRLGLYGHQHKTQVAPHEIWLPDRERMAVVSAGSLCAGPQQLPIGVHRQYNILNISPNFRSVRVHLRAMAVANLFSRGNLPDFGGATFADLDWEPPKNLGGTSVDTEAVRTRHIIDEAELATHSGNPARAVQLLRQLALPLGTYARQLFLTASIAANNWRAIIDATETPRSIQELVQRVEALAQLKEFAQALDALDCFSRQLQLPDPIAAELRNRVRAKEAMRK
ncbi:MAG: metallophosphoesterase [Polyangiaceae bacterium]|nr:metallophosphoesterase [Polyangiaceae bacterium]